MSDPCVVGRSVNEFRGWFVNVVDCSEFDLQVEATTVSVQVQKWFVNSNLEIQSKGQRV
jgi:hypothetical protein